MEVPMGLQDGTCVQKRPTTSVKRDLLLVSKETY
jgi:hypothetical protein